MPIITSFYLKLSYKSSIFSYFVFEMNSTLQYFVNLMLSKLDVTGV